jgi:hypothetical protein
VSIVDGVDLVSMDIAGSQGHPKGVVLIFCESGLSSCVRRLAAAVAVCNCDSPSDDPIKTGFVHEGTGPRYSF